MSVNRQPWDGVQDTRPANKQHQGLMPRHHAGDSTHATFATQLVRGHSDIYVPLATASLAGALSAADFTKLGTLQVPVNRLAFVASTDLLSATAITASTWTDVGTAQSFTASSTAAIYLVTVRAAVMILTTGTTGGALRLINDLGGTVPLGGGAVTGAGRFVMPGGAFDTSGFSAGSHTWKLQLFVNAAGCTAFCRCSTSPDTEFYQMRVLEYNP